MSIATDNQGGVQLYYTKRDQEYHEGSSGTMGGFETGAAENAHPTQMLAVGGLSVTWGMFDGSDAQEKGTAALEGNAVEQVLGVGPFSGDYYVFADPVTGETDPSRLTGFDIGGGYPGPLTMGSISIKSIPLTGRKQIPSWAVPACQQLLGQCGSLTPPGLNNPLFSPPPVLNPPKNRTPIFSPGTKYPHTPGKLRDFIQ